MVSRNFLFETVKVKEPPKNNFNLSFINKMTIDFGGLYPAFCKAVLPGDAWRVKANIFARFMPMSNPVMHNCNVYIHYFFVPYYLLWKDFYEFITGGKDGTSSPAFPVSRWAGATIVSGRVKDFSDGSLWDYLGFPSLVENGTFPSDVSLMPFKAYQLIYNEYFRDQNLQDEIDIDFENKRGTNSAARLEELNTLMTIRYRAWEKDYFTSALPFAQRGPSVGLGTTSTPVSLAKSATKIPFLEGSTAEDTAGVRKLGLAFEQGAYSSGAQLGTDTEGHLVAKDNTGQESTNAVYLNPNGSLVVNGTLFDINQLRNSMRLQEWLEKNARGGARYPEQLLAHFGVISDDLRLGRPQYLGGGVQPVTMTEVTQTSADSSDNQVLGQWAGNGYSVGSDNGWTHYFKSHGLILGIISVLPRSGYFQGIPREWTKVDKLDFAWPEFANLGEQEIHNKELFYDGSSGSVDLAEEEFGYTPRYAEYKFSNDEYHGQFRSTLLNWHLGRAFLANPNLNADFIKVTPSDTSRIFANTSYTQATDNHILAEVDFSCDVIRCLPKYGTPTF